MTRLKKHFTYATEDLKHHVYIINFTPTRRFAFCKIDNQKIAARIVVKTTDDKREFLSLADSVKGYANVYAY
jgi:hypothetical protein